MGQLVSLTVFIGGFAMNPSMLFGIIILFLTFIDLIQKRSTDLTTEILVVLFALYSILICFFFSPVPGQSLSWTLKIITWMLLVLAAQKTFSDPEDHIKLTRIVLIATCAVIVSFLLSRIGVYGESLTYETGVRLYSAGFSSGKAIAYYLCFAILVLFVRLSDKKYISKFVFSGICLLSLVVILFSFVRAPVVGLFIAFLVYQALSGIYLKKNVFKALVITSGMMFFVCLAYFLGNETEFLARWTELGKKAQDGQIEKLGSGRIGGLMSFYEFYISELSIVKKILGTGLGSSGYYLGSGKVIHNDYAEMLMGTGLIGFSLYALILWRILKKLFYLAKATVPLKMKSAVCVSISGFFTFLSFNMTNVSSGLFFLSLWAIHTGVVMGAGSAACESTTK